MAQEQMLQYQLHIEARKNKLAKLKAKLAQQEQQKAAKKTLKANPEEWNMGPQQLALLSQQSVETQKSNIEDKFVTAQVIDRQATVVTNFTEKSMEEIVLQNPNESTFTGSVGLGSDCYFPDNGTMLPQQQTSIYDQQHNSCFDDHDQLMG